MLLRSATQPYYYSDFLQHLGMFHELKMEKHSTWRGGDNLEIATITSRADISPVIPLSSISAEKTSVLRTNSQGAD